MLSTKSLALKILIQIGDIALMPFQIAEMAAFSRGAFYNLDIPEGLISQAVQAIAQARSSDTLYHLKKSGYLKPVPNKEGFLTLTPKAQKEITRCHLRQKAQAHAWDGKFRVIIFDVFEATRIERDFLRRVLKEIGCQQLQKSVWVTPWDIEQDLRAFISLTRERLNGDMRIITAEKIDNDADLYEIFSLAKTKKKKISQKLKSS